MRIRKRYILISTILLASIFCSGASADLLFQDDFESDLSAWTGKSGGAHHGIIVEDPLNLDNHVLTFTGTNTQGDIYTKQSFALLDGKTYTIAFDYLGQSGSVPGGSGGFAGLSEALPGDHMWYYGTSDAACAAPILVDDGQWHHYLYNFLGAPETGSDVHLMFEDFYHWLEGVPGDAYFDNVVLHAPLPGALLLGGMGLGIAGWRLKQKKV